MEYIKISKHKKFIEVVLDRPESRNAFHPKMIEELTQCFSGIKASDDLRFVVLRGSGKAFCAGADLNWMKSMVDFTLEQNLSDSQALQKMFVAIEYCPVPVLTFVHGFVMGGALGLVAASDIVVADASTQFCFSEVRLGLLPAVISEFVIKKADSHAMRAYLISGEMFDSQRAQNLNLITSIDEELNQDWESFSDRLLTHAWVKRLNENAPEAMRQTKELLPQVSRASEDQVSQLTTHAIASKRVSEEGQEGLKSFLEKRSPNWREQ